MRHRNYRLLFTGQSISLIGTWMQRTALIWLVYRLTDSVSMMGLVDFIGQIPSFLLTPFAGVMLDRWERYRVIMIAQILTMVQGLTFAFLILTGRIEVWQILILSFSLGLINAFDIPARQSFVIDVVDDRQDLGNAIALNSALFNSARIFGPSIAGATIAALGEGLCFLVNGLAHGATVAALRAMRLVPRKRIKARHNVLEGLREGFVYVYRSTPIRSALMLLCLTSFMGMPVMMLLPVFAGKILAGGPQTLGLLLTTFGFGALLATIYLASRSNVIGLEKIIVVAGSIFSISLMVFSHSQKLWLSLLTIFLAGFGMIAQTASINTVLQTLVEEDKRGRVMSMYVMAFGGTTPFGSLVAGNVASFIGTPYTLFLGALCCLAGVIAFGCHLPVWRQHAHLLYSAKEMM